MHTTFKLLLVLATLVLLASCSAGKATPAPDELSPQGTYPMLLPGGFAWPTAEELAAFDREAAEVDPEDALYRCDVYNTGILGSLLNAIDTGYFDNGSEAYYMGINEMDTNNRFVRVSERTYGYDEQMDYYAYWQTLWEWTSDPAIYQ